MKQFLSILILLALGLTSFAQDFSQQKIKTLKGMGKIKQYLLTVDNVPDGYYSSVKVCAQIQKQFAGKNPTLAQIETFVKNKKQADDGIIIYAFSKRNLALLTQACNKQQTDCSYLYLAKLLFMHKKYKQVTELKQVNKYLLIYHKFLSYYFLGDKANTWKYGKKLFEDFYVANANAATEILTKMFNRRPIDLKDNQVAQFLKYIADKYPTPGSDFETWRSFMGFVGFRYKSATGKDLFTK